MNRRNAATPAPQPEDAELFRAHVSDVKPLPRSAHAELVRPRPQPVPLQRLRDESAVLRESLAGAPAWEIGLETGEELSYARAGLGHDVLRKLRRGHWAIQDELDLHGLTVVQARAELAQFLKQCLRRGLRCVRIVHGKGQRSRQREPVLKRKVAVWLIQREEVLAYCQARRADGGSGAVVVLLRGARHKAQG
jgi:DNA-nicking Smr family endonuclease